VPQHRERDIPGEHIAENVVWEERHLRHAFARLQLPLDPKRNAHTLSLNEQQVRRHERGGDGRQHGHVEPEEPRQRRARDIVAAAQQPEEKRAGEGHAPAMPVPTFVAKNDSSFHGNK
jgi:hypothetical protein